MIEQIKLIYKPKGFDTKYLSNNESEKNTFNFALNFKKYYQIIMKENENIYKIMLIYFNSLNIFCR